MEEPISDFYYKELKKSNNKVQTMVAFYKSLFNIKSVDNNLYISFGRLIKIYGQDIIFFALLDCADVDNISFDGISRLLSYFAKKRFESKHSYSEPKDLNDLAKSNLNKLTKQKSLKIPDPFNERGGR